jgi:hypothetical protein
MHFILSFCLSLLASSCWASAPPLIKTRHFTHTYVAVASLDPAVPSFWPCSHAKLIELEEAMVHARAMAQTAAAALNVANSERSESYCWWFGHGAPYILTLAATC